VGAGRGGRVTKPEQIEAFAALLADRAASLRSTVAAARSGTRVDGSHRPANRGERGAVTSQGYLAAGLASRLADIEAALARLAEVPISPRSTVTAGARIEVDDGTRRRYLVLPGGSGEIVDDVTVLSPRSPIVRALLGREEGDVAELERGGELIELELLSVE